MQDHHPRGGTIHNELRRWASAVTQIPRQKTTFFPTGQFDSSLFSVEYSFFPNDSCLCEVVTNLARRELYSHSIHIKGKEYNILDGVQNDEISLRTEIPGNIENVKYLAPCLVVIHLYLLTRCNLFQNVWMCVLSPF